MSSLSAQNISIEDFGKSFSNGLAFCAILHHFIPHKIPYSTLDDTDKVSHSTLTNSLLFLVAVVKTDSVNKDWCTLEKNALNVVISYAGTKLQDSVRGRRK